MKPEKIIYDDQERVHSDIVDFSKSLVKDLDCECYLVGSSVTGKFGKYVERYGEHEGSDIDLVVFVDEVPSGWKYLNTERDWWRLYRAGKFEINDIAHLVDVLVVKKGMRDFAINRMKELEWVSEKI